MDRIDGDDVVARPRVNRSGPRMGVGNVQTVGAGSEIELNTREQILDGTLKTVVGDSGGDHAKASDRVGGQYAVPDTSILIVVEIQLVGTGPSLQFQPALDQIGESANVVDATAIPAGHDRLGADVRRGNGQRIATFAQPEVQLIEILINDVPQAQSAETRVGQTPIVAASVTTIVEVENIARPATSIDREQPLNLVQ